MFQPVLVGVAFQGFRDLGPQGAGCASWARVTRVHGLGWRCHASSKGPNHGVLALGPSMNLQGLNPKSLVLPPRSDSLYYGSY